MIIRKRSWRGNNGERGQAILEFLPVMVLMLTLAFAVIDFGYFIWQSQVIIGLTREGSNLASRDMPLSGAAAAVISDGSVLNLSSRGRVIITSVENIGTASASNFVITGQYSTGNLSATSKIGTYTGSGTPRATILVPTGFPPVPQPGASVFVTEIYCSFTPITPLGYFVQYTMPSKTYDVAYF